MEAQGGEVIPGHPASHQQGGLFKASVSPAPPSGRTKALGYNPSAQAQVVTRTDTGPGAY